MILDRSIYCTAERVSAEAPVPVLRVVRLEERRDGTGELELTRERYYAAAGDGWQLMLEVDTLEPI